MIWWSKFSLRHNLSRLVLKARPTAPVCRLLKSYFSLNILGKHCQNETRGRETQAPWGLLTRKENPTWHFSGPVSALWQTHTEPAVLKSRRLCLLRILTPDTQMLCKAGPYSRGARRACFREHWWFFVIQIFFKAKRFFHIILDLF